ncbi:hypothetical protein H6G36_10370 [Anabaena minutissima FACHB-250]|nr:hypothetical protein [Anabaena minutissima FACHB-250]
MEVKLGQPAIVTSEYGDFTGELRGTVEQIGLQICKTRLNQNQNHPTSAKTGSVFHQTSQFFAFESDYLV